MEQLFLTILNMSITASYVILMVLLVRVILKKAPKRFSYFLWGIVLFRLICPISFNFAFSFFGLFKENSMEHIPSNIGYMSQPEVNIGISAVDNWTNSVLPAATPYSSVNPMQILMFLISQLWMIGVISLLIYSIVSYIMLKRKVSTAMLVSDNIYESEKIKSPFVMGIVKPKIYFPIALKQDERQYILLHEHIHMKRLDYIIKPFAFLVLCLHWFNPLVWISFVLMSRDMEMSCDERVLKELGKGIKKNYSNSLLALSINKMMPNGSPLAFGESNTKKRIKNVLNYKKPTFWVLVVSLVIVVLMSIGLITNPKSDEQDLSFLNISHTASVAIQQDQLMIRVHSISTTLISGKDFGKYLDKASNSWSESEYKGHLTDLAKPDLTVYININSDHRVNFYKSEPTLAMVELNGDYRTYKIPEETYEELFMMWATRSYAIPEEVVKAIVKSKKIDEQTTQDVPNDGDYKILHVGNQQYYIYQKKDKYYVEQPHSFIRELSEEVYKEALAYATSPTDNESKVSQDIINLVEDNLATILSSPLQSSSPYDYIKENQMAYDNILKYGGEEALSYMLSEFKKGHIKDDLRGHIIKRLCIELLGQRNNVTDESLSPNEWFIQLSIRQKVELPDFIYDGDDPIEKLVYMTEVEKNKGRRGEFTIVAPHIFGSYEDGNKLKVFATTFSTHYILYEKTLSNEGGSIIPVAMTFVKNEDGEYILEDYQQAKDGSYFASSIREFCVMPISGKEIPHLADEILDHYGHYDDIIELERENLIKHLKKHNQYDVFLYEKNYNKPDEYIPLT